MTRRVSLTMWTLRAVAALALAAFPPQARALGADVKTISAVEVQNDGGMTRIVLRGAKDAIYTAFMKDNPPRLIIELPDVAFEGVNTPISVKNGLVEDVTLGAFGDVKAGHNMARVSIALAKAAEYEVKPQGDEISIELHAGAGDSAADAAPAAQQGPPDVSPDDEAAFANAAAESAPATAPAQPAVPTPKSAKADTAKKPAAAAAKAHAKGGASAKVKALVASANGIEIEADGPIDNVDSFLLSNPDRVVVDVFGAKMGMAKAKESFADGPVSQARIGEHPDKVRVVLDLRMKTGKPTVVPTAKGVRIELTGDGKTAGATDSASAAPAAPDAAMAEGEAAAPAGAPAGAAATGGAPETGDATVQSVHFESLPGVDRVVLTLGKKVTATQFEPDPGTLMVLLKGAMIDAATERRVDTKEFGGPVEMFSVFKTPDVPNPEVRVLIKRNSPEKAKLTWEGGQLRIEMARPGGAPPAAPAMGDSTPAGAGAPAAADPAAAVPADLPADAGANAAPASPAGAMPAGDSAAPADSGAPGKAIATEIANKHTPASIKTANGGQVAFDPFLDGPADPASIDILEEGGFDEEKQYQGRRISLDFKDADIGNILRLIAEVSDLNVIAGQDVTGKVTIRLVDVPWDQALDVILLTKGLGFVRIGNILRIAPTDVLKTEREARLQERRSREKLEDLVVKLQPVNFAKAGDLDKLVKRLLSTRGSVNVDERTNTLIIKDIPSVIHEATALVKAVDTQTPQVLIEAKIVEASLKFSRGLGAIWGVGWKAPTDSTGDVRPALFGSGDQSNNFLANNTISAATGLLNMGILGLDDKLQLDIQLQAQEENNDGKVISSPRVITLDNKSATIKQGVAIKFTEATADKLTTTFVDAVLQLKVTPHITANRSIIMKLGVSKNAPALDASGGSVVGINKNETQTEAILHDGETMVLGGIYVMDSGRGSTKVPFLADIPIIGTAFKSQTLKDERRELLVFVTPRVVNSVQADVE
jgi:type IV pilus assembly protein PilQ